LTRWAIAALCFTCAAVLFTGQVWVDYAYAGHRLSWTRAFGVALAEWELWTLLAPLVMFLSERVPISRGLSSLAVHVPASVVIAAIKLILAAMLAGAIARAGRAPLSLLQVHVTLATYWAIVAATHLAEQSRLARERQLRSVQLEAELARAQVEALKMQLHPHFLFNTLNAISGLMREDVEAADVMLTQLSELLRRTFETEGVQRLPLAEEVQFLQTYLAIQQTRHGSRLRVDLDVPAACEYALVPTLILQPIVENAIRHGFSVTPGPGTIVIRAAIDRRRLHIDVMDDGPGPPEPIRDGYGLRNTRSRLRALYGDNAALAIARRREGGTLARLDLPLERTYEL
jgi:LytS/YehU family sensor histidine kinase